MKTRNMAEPPEFWAFLLANLVLGLFGGVLTALSFTAYRRNGKTSFRNATLGFAFVTLGGSVEPIYQLPVKGSYELGGREMLALQSVEGILIGLGLALLFFSIYAYERPSTGAELGWTPSGDAEDPDMSSNREF